MSLRAKALVVMIVSGAIMAAALGVVSGAVLMRSYIRLEEKLALDDVERARGAIEMHLASMRRTVSDWSLWDDTYEHLTGDRPGYPDDNLSNEAISTLELNTMAFISLSGELVSHKSVDIEEEVEVPTPGGLVSYLKIGGPLLALAEEGAGSGLLRLEEGVILFAVSRVLRTDRTGPSVGWMFVGRFVDETLVETIAESSRLDLAVMEIGDASGTTDDAHRITLMLEGGLQEYISPKEGHLVAYGIIEDVYGAPLMVVRVLEERLVTEQGWKTIKVFFLTMLGVGLALGAFATIEIDRHVLRRLQKLTAAVGELRATSRGSLNVPADGHDEISRLVTAMNEMLSARAKAESDLKAAQAKLVEVARQAGMAQVATNVLHNVGNVLNSVNVSVSAAMGILRGGRGEKLKGLAEVVRSHEGDMARFVAEDPQGKLLPQYVARLCDAVSDEIGRAAKELESTQTHVGHINGIIALQQTLTGAAEAAEALRVNDVLMSAIEIVRSSMERHGVRLESELADAPECMLDRHRLIQTIVNILDNAVYAVKTSPEAEKCVRVATRFDAAEGQIAIEITDNGVGIRQEDMDRIFAHGFTTKKGGHGYGLHSAALTAKEMGGKLETESEGPGKGATFRIVLPYRRTGSPS